ncbi:acetyl-CoA C-acyltransferase [Acinetobacter nosocomialis]|uniref:acetyl-CoA C-acyltransferase n=1 Tax=Acinetobacter calcoaceticus/baumannii complex TaxID=909768 RepID=UPI00229730C7|nr:MULTISPECIES: acetyl-CoA C-acyltransferase [Acinetobacter calcoaceticus/baumannii complex]MDO7509511.1 acetyl-CoA C-acyltransferase [Acinetobacter baumannii]MDO7192453.1 acetyl-CoA C-acyltransferase [Acinetobacter nosocomialis]MDV7627549.1 acetyl-CoA C-acyltransferase [Acinetobacter baumannii]MDV7646110.1 acetyl-CoA C-acyltransferase [Acinetobacter baumannii]MDV7652995.1 acetyl-CoA C-acyltransferase [Acinetobacter baumannii]
MHEEIVILSAVRTPMGSFLGELLPFSAHELGSHAIREAVRQSEVNPEHIDQVMMGCVLPAGQGQAPARQAALKAGLQTSVACTTLNKVCGSGMQAIIFGQNLLKVSQAEVVVAGGMESMSNTTYLMSRARTGYRMGHSKIFDHMFLDGLEDAYQPGRLMGTFAEESAETYQLSREAQDSFAITSLKRARNAIENGNFDDEIVPIAVEQKNQRLTIMRDEQPLKAKIEKITQLKPAFSSNGTVTAANASSISDGAAALVLSSLNYAQTHAIQPLAKIVSQAVYAGEPHLFTTAPVFAIQKLLKQCDWQVGDVDLFEINEAFAIVPMIAMQELDINHDKVNVNGGACALGHPLGTSGARIVVTLIHALKQRNLKRGIAAICIGGGEALAIAIEIF